MSYLGLAISLFPFIVPYQYTIWQAASSGATQAFLLIGALLLLPVILLYTGGRTGCSAARCGRTSAITDPGFVRMAFSPETLLVLLHGVGSNGANLAPLGEALQEFLPGAAIAAPDAPHPFDAGGDGRQWFSVVGVNDANRARRVVEARADFDRVVAREIDMAGFAGRLDRVAFFGFSQGAILSLDALADGRWPVAAVVAASGRLAVPVGPKPAAATPALILHGERDEVIPAAEATRAQRLLEAAGFSVEARVYPGLGHSVSIEGLEAAAAFLAGRLERPAG